MTMTPKTNMIHFWRHQHTPNTSSKNPNRVREIVFLKKQKLGNPDFRKKINRNKNMFKLQNTPRNAKSVNLKNCIRSRGLKPN